MTAPATEKLTLERMFRASLAEVWALWTTREGLEGWFCPDGLAFTVSAFAGREGEEEGEIVAVLD